MSIDVKELTDQADLEQVFRLRYRVYVEEIGARMKHADHERRIIRDPLDKTARVLGAFVIGELVGSVRLNWASHDKDNYAEYYNMRAFGKYFPERTTFTNKLVVAAEFRKSPVAITLAVEGFKIYCRSDAAFDFIDCKGDLKPFFLKLGYRQVFPDVVGHPESGATHYPMVLVNADIDHLTKVRSPFRRVIEHLPKDPSSVEFFKSEILPKSIGVKS